MAQSSYTKCFTGAVVLLMVLGASVCEARLLKQFTTINSNFASNPDVNPPAIDFDSIIGSILNPLKEEAMAEDQAARNPNGLGGGLFGTGRRLSAKHGEVITTGGASVSTSGKGSASTSSATEVSVSPGVSTSGGKKSGVISGETSTTVSTSTLTSASTEEVKSATAGKGNPRFNTGSKAVGEDVLHAGGQAASDAGDVSVVAPSKKTTEEAVESEVAGSSKDTTVLSDDPVIVGQDSVVPHFSGSEVSIDLEASSSSGAKKISVGTRTRGKKSASSSLGLSVATGKQPHEALVPVPATAGTGDH